MEADPLYSQTKRFEKDISIWLIVALPLKEGYPQKHHQPMKIYGRSVRCTTLYRILTHPTNTPAFQGPSLWGVAFAPTHL